MLKEKIADPTIRQRVVVDCVKLIDEEVSNKGGLSGLAIKGAYSVVKAIKKGVIPETLDYLLDGFIVQLEPFYARYEADKKEAFSALIIREKNAAAEALLGVTDQRARVATNQTMKKAYEKLRPSAKDHVLSAVPGLGRLLDKYV